MTRRRWEWFPGVTSLGDECAGCDQPVAGAADLVAYAHVLWHVGCLLDDVTSEEATRLPPYPMGGSRPSLE
jgi:hypothetical protein